ncbi:MAG: MMPL family transporter, partial [Myxococcota bacterium]
MPEGDRASDIESRVGAWLERWVRGAASRPASVILAVLSLAGLAGYASATRIQIEGSTAALFSPDLPFKQNEHRYYAAFPTQYENMFIVVDALTPERAGWAAEALASELRAHPQRFHSVFLPGGGSFFERNAFLYLDTDELQMLADQLVTAQPYLAELSRDGSLR